jgi:hypothetical protein
MRAYGDLERANEIICGAVLAVRGLVVAMPDVVAPDWELHQNAPSLSASHSDASCRVAAFASSAVAVLFVRKASLQPGGRAESGVRLHLLRSCGHRSFGGP